MFAHSPWMPKPSKPGDAIQYNKPFVTQHRHLIFAPFNRKQTSAAKFLCRKDVVEMMYDSFMLAGNRKRRTISPEALPTQSGLSWIQLAERARVNKSETRYAMSQPARWQSKHPAPQLDDLRQTRRDRNPFNNANTFLMYRQPLSLHYHATLDSGGKNVKCYPSIISLRRTWFVLSRIYIYCHYLDAVEIFLLASRHH